MTSLSFKVLHHSVSLFVCDHTLVRALHFVHEHDINIGLCALLETCGHHQSVEQIVVMADLRKLLAVGSTDELLPHTCVALLTHICEKFINDYNYIVYIN